MWRPTAAGLALLTSLGTLAGVGVAAEPQASYQGRGRRDPFVSPTRWGAGPAGSCASAGLGGLRVREVALRGVVTSGVERVALIVSPEGESHFARVGQRLCDGTVSGIEASSVSFRVQPDPLAGADAPLQLTLALHP